MNEHQNTLHPQDGCRTACAVLRDLWVDERLQDLDRLSDLDHPVDLGHLDHLADSSGSGRSALLPSAADEQPDGSNGPQEAQRAPRSDRLSSALVDPAILRHIESCPSCRREAAELGRLGRSLHTGLDSLCGAIAGRMECDIEGTLRKIREEPQPARLLRRSRQRLRLVLWVGFLAFTFLASVLLAIAAHKALQGH